MERTIIQGIKRLRVLTPYDYDNMDELVQDLSNALEESSYSRLSPSKVKKGRSWKRRSKSTGNLIALGSSVPKSSAVSEDSESSLDDRIRFHMEISANGSQPQSDSDDIQPTRQHHHQQLTSWRHCTANMVESDSVNENFHPARQHRRKRKFKRMAVDPQPGVETELRAPSAVPLMQKTKRVRSLRTLKNKAKLSKFCDIDVENICGAYVEEQAGFCGKRKRSIRERSVECSGYDERQDFRIPGKLMVSTDGSSNWSGQSHFMEFDGTGTTKTQMEASSSSLSSSESDCGILTNDEGREADDEQSDFFHEPGPACGIPGVTAWWEDEQLLPNSPNSVESKFEAILTGSFQYMSETAKQVYRLRVSRFQARTGREIRAGRRRLGKMRPAFSIMTSVNEKISRFMQDPLQNELRICHLQPKDSEQLNQLAALYSLDIHQEGPLSTENTVLIKTRHTPQAISLEPTLGKNPVGDIKRRRRTPPVVQGCVGEAADPIPESNIGNRMLKNMGWEPGTGLGALGQGIQSPLMVYARAKNRGLGYGNYPEPPQCLPAPPPPPPPSPQPFLGSGGDSVGDFVPSPQSSAKHLLELGRFGEHSGSGDSTTV